MHKLSTTQFAHTQQKSILVVTHCRFLSVLLTLLDAAYGGGQGEQASMSNCTLTVVQYTPPKSSNTGTLALQEEGKVDGYAEQCQEKRRHVPHHPPSSSSSSQQQLPISPPPLLSMFGRPSGCIDQLTTIERAAIVTLHNLGWTGRSIAQEIHCSEHTVSLWLQR